MLPRNSRSIAPLIAALVIAIGAQAAVKGRSAPGDQVRATERGVVLAAMREHHVSGEQASAAAREAIRHAGGEWATLVKTDEPGVLLKFRVIRRDGSTEEVPIGEDLHVIATGQDQ